MDYDPLEDSEDDEWEFLENAELNRDIEHMAEEAQRSGSEPNRLRENLYIIQIAAKLWEVGVDSQVADPVEFANYLSSMKDWIQKSCNQSLSSLIRQVASNPGCPSNQAAIRTITEYPSLSGVLSDDFPQSDEDLENRRPAQRFELEDYTDLVNTNLHDTFYRSKFLPCKCKGDDGAIRLSENFTCALRLDGYQYVFGDDRHCFFDTVFAKDGDESHEWTPVQFQLPRNPENVSRIPFPSDSKNNLPISKRQLDDFCEIFRWNFRKLRIHIHININQRSGPLWSQEEKISNIFPSKGAPILLSTALESDELSARHKIFLAFAVSKAFWQYYNSLWMDKEWSLETIQLLQTKDRESEAPFLKIRSVESENLNSCKGESGVSPDGIPRMHSYPYIFNLGLLLVQLGSITPDKTTGFKGTTHLTSTVSDNRLCASCFEEFTADAWPRIDLPTIHKSRYQRIVENCFPTSTNGPKPLFEAVDVAGRRSALKTHIVRPLFELLQDMMDVDETTLQPSKTAQTNESLITSAGNGVNKTLKSNSDLAFTWLNTITNSWLHGYVSNRIERSRRPKIALIDTGFDSQARFVDHKLKKRLNMVKIKDCNWKDYWQSETAPQDEDGHGTSMLSIIHRIAPFADICVARVAGKNEDLKNDPISTGENLANAIGWAVKQQNADIISLSLGWEEEPLSQRNTRAISNAINDALSHQNQHLLIFAAASNLGGSKRELFPAKHVTVFSIRGTNTKGKHEDFNPSLPNRGGDVFGTLGLEVPSSNRGSSNSQYIHRSGTSVATALTAGLAAIVISYINIGQKKSWEKIRTFEGFHRLLYKLSTETEVRKRFITLENHFDQESFESALDSASTSKS